MEARRQLLGVSSHPRRNQRWLRLREFRKNKRRPFPSPSGVTPSSALSQAQTRPRTGRFASLQFTLLSVPAGNASQFFVVNHVISGDGYSR